MMTTWGTKFRLRWVATGIDNMAEEKIGGRVVALNKEVQKKSVQDYAKVVNLRDVTLEEIEEEWTVKKNGVCLDTPTFARKESELDNGLKEENEKKRKKGFLERFRLKDGLDYPTFLRVKAD